MIANRNVKGIVNAALSPCMTVMNFSYLRVLADHSYMTRVNRNYAILVFFPVASLFVHKPTSLRRSTLFHIIQSVSIMSFTTFSINGHIETINAAINCVLFTRHDHTVTHAY